jgi:hypothetical protein
MSGANSVPEINQELARKINEEARQNPQSPYANKYVGIANGKVVVITDNLDQLAEALRLAEPDSTKTFWVEASRNYDEPEEIWGFR